jgi:hypothetical protein
MWQCVGEDAVSPGSPGDGCIDVQTSARWGGTGFQPSRDNPMTPSVIERSHWALPRRAVALPVVPLCFSRGGKGVGGAGRDGLSDASSIETSAPNEPALDRVEPPPNLPVRSPANVRGRGISDDIPRLHLPVRPGHGRPVPRNRRPPGTVPSSNGLSSSHHDAPLADPAPCDPPRGIPASPRPARTHGHERMP